jgi:hypothetical protein
MHPQFVWNKEQFVNMDNGSIICVLQNQLVHNA